LRADIKLSIYNLTYQLTLTWHAVLKAFIVTKQDSLCRFQSEECWPVTPT